MPVHCSEEMCSVEDYEDFVQICSAALVWLLGKLQWLRSVDPQATAQKVGDILNSLCPHLENSSWEART